MKKRNAVLLLFAAAVVSVLLCGCEKDDVQIFSIASPAKVTLQSENVVVEITDAETVKLLTEEITSKQFHKTGEVDFTGWTYWLKWYDENDEVIFDATVDSTKIVYGGYVWNCVDGIIDTACFDELLKIE